MYDPYILVVLYYSFGCECILTLALTHLIFQLVWLVPVPFLLTGAVYACAYVVFWNYGEGLAKGRMFRCVRLSGSCSWRDRVQWVARLGGAAWKQFSQLLAGWWGLH